MTILDLLVRVGDPLAVDNRHPPRFFSALVSSARRFYLDLSPPRRIPLAVVSGGCEHCAPRYQVRRRDFPYWGVEFVAGGEGVLHMGRRIWSLAAGTVFVYGPGIAHEITHDPQRPLVKYFVDFSGTRARPLLGEAGLVPGVACQTSAPAEVAALFDELIRTGLRGAPRDPRLAPLVLEQLLLRLGDTAIPHGSSTTAAFATYRRCRNLLEGRWMHLRSLGQLAAECHVDAAYLCRLFRRFDHHSPYKTLQRLRMNLAAQRLLTGTPIKAVAAELGFSDPFHFSRVFKGVMGLSPSRFASTLARDHYPMAGSSFLHDKPPNPNEVPP